MAEILLRVGLSWQSVNDLSLTLSAISLSVDHFPTLKRTRRVLEESNFFKVFYR